MVMDWLMMLFFYRTSGVLNVLNESIYYKKFILFYYLQII